MVTKRLALTAAFSLACCSTFTHAAYINATYAWTGAKGWSASGAIRYDDAIMLPAAAGPSWGAFSTGIEYLDLSIFDNTGLLKGSWIEIAESIPLYPTLRITIDTRGAVDVLAAGTKLDLGITTDTTRPDYFSGNIGTGKTAVIVWGRVIADSGPGAAAFTPIPDPPTEPIPAPGAASLLLLGLGLVAMARRRRNA